MTELEGVNTPSFHLDCEVKGLLNLLLNELNIFRQLTAFFVKPLHSIVFFSDNNASHLHVLVACAVQLFIYFPVNCFFTKQTCIR